MRISWILLAGASLVACNQREAEADTRGGAMPATSASLSYDGADYGDDKDAMRAHGERLSHVLGCRGCHTDDLTGMPFPPAKEGIPETGIWAPNITRSLQDMDDAALRRLLTEGVHPTRAKLWMMPSMIFQHLSDADLDALIAHLRTVEPKGEKSPLPAPTPAFLEMVDKGIERPIGDLMARYRDDAPEDLGADYALGRHVAMTSCAECHNNDLQGIPDFTPSLLEVGPMYDDAAFTALLTEGQGLEGRKLDLMALVGKEHFSYLTPAERKAVIDYVHALAKKKAETPQ